MQIHINICKNVEKYIKKNSSAAAAALPPADRSTPGNLGDAHQTLGPAPPRSEEIFIVKSGR